LPRHADSMENLARYIIRASFAQDRMTYLPREAQVIYESRDAKRTKTFEALEWLAAMCSHVANKGEQMVRYYGYYSNVCRGKRKAKGEDDSLPTVLHPDKESSAPSRKEWARMIQKIYEVDPLTCPKCNGAMRILAFIEDQEVIRKILHHLGLWKRTPRAPPPPLPPDIALDTSLSQVPTWEDDLNQDPGFPIDWSA
ncbi:MAG: transposase, partial [Deltaproteobacteria bacterium]|nr:transposase [Deltaproteobacteria bacterium]